MDTEVTNPRSSTVLVSLIAALLIPRIQRLTGVELSNEDIAALIGLGTAAFHGLLTFIERFIPPKPDPRTPP